MPRADPKDTEDEFSDKSLPELIELLHRVADEILLREMEQA